MTLSYQRSYDYAIKTVFWAALSYCIFRLAVHEWVSDDSLISFRVVDNFVHGYGLRWNIDERVQAFTNPLWVLLTIPLYALWPNVLWVSSTLSFACAVGSIILVLRILPASWLAQALFLLLIAFSKTLTMYFSSGLENPLTSLLFAAFAYKLWQSSDDPHWLYLSLLTALAMVDRLDTLIAYLPIWLWLIWTYRASLKFPQWKAIMIGALPIIAWLCFSLFYYGFLFPNTKYAKLNGGIPESRYLELGWNYFQEFAYSDPIMAILMTAVVLHALIIRLPRLFRAPHDRDNALLLMMALGLIAYNIYVLFVGGSFVSCRFSSLPAFMALWLALAEWRNYWSKPLVFIFISIIAFDLFAIRTKPFWVYQTRHYQQIGEIYDVSAGSWLYNVKKRSWLVEMKQKRSPWCAPDDPPDAESIGAAGFGSYEEPPCLHLVDVFALGDPLLARLPSAWPVNRVGHLQRHIPRGYLHALKSGSLAEMDPDIANYYAPLRLIVAGDLWSWERLKTILFFNLGYYDHWRDAFVSRHTANISTQIAP